jgi:hypothetical protein
MNGIGKDYESTHLSLLPTAFVYGVYADVSDSRLWRSSVLLTSSLPKRSSSIHSAMAKHIGMPRNTYQTIGWILYGTLESNQTGNST